jgi:hypothetical protein
MKPARFIQLIEVQKALYALDEEGKVWQYKEDSSTNGYAWIPLSSKRYEEPAEEPTPTMGFRNERTEKKR